MDAGQKTGLDDFQSLSQRLESDICFTVAAKKKQETTFAVKNVKTPLNEKATLSL